MLEILQRPAVIRLIGTALLLVALLVLRHLIARWIVRGAHILDENQRRQLVWLRMAVTVLFVLGVLAIWGGALQTVLLSLTAVVLALVIATKELLMCVSGFALRATSRLFSVGDWIECNGLRGEITDHSIMSTTLLETDPPEFGYGYTGRRMVVPNSLFLTHAVRTSFITRRWVMHRFVITLETPVDASAAADWLAARAERAVAPFIDEARPANAELDRRLGVDVEGPDPEIGLGTSDIGKQQFRVLVFCPRVQALALERDITADFLSAASHGQFAPEADAADREPRSP